LLAGGVALNAPVLHFNHRRCANVFFCKHAMAQGHVYFAHIEADLFVQRQQSFLDDWAERALNAVYSVTSSGLCARPAGA